MPNSRDSTFASTIVSYLAEGIGGAVRAGRRLRRDVIAADVGADRHLRLDADVADVGGRAAVTSDPGVWRTQQFHLFLQVLESE